MKEQFHIGLTFDFRHDYFLEKIPKGIKIKPLRVQSHFFDHQNLVFREEQAGFSLLCPVTYSFSATVPATFRFWVYFTDPGFFYYTDGIPSKPAGDIFLLNLTLDKSSVNTSTEISWNHIPVGNLEEKPPQGATAVLEILIPQGMDKIPVHGVLSFNTRSTYWRYYIINPSPEEKRQFSIRALKGEIQFNDTEQTIILSNGKKANVIDSSQPVPLQEFQAVHLQLQETYADAPATILIPELALPSPNSLWKRKDTVSGTFTSEVFIYLPHKLN